MPELSHQSAALKSARKRKDWSQSRLASALERAARVLRLEKDLPPGGRQTLVQYISYFENGKREVPDRLKPIFREAFQATDEELGFINDPEPVGFGTSLAVAIPTAHLRSSGPTVISSLRMVLETNVQADARIGPPYLIPAV